MNGIKVLSFDLDKKIDSTSLQVETSLRGILDEYISMYSKNIGDTYTDVNKILFLLGDNKTISCSSLFGYSDSKDCQLDILWEDENIKNNGTTLSCVTDYIFNELEMELVKICVTDTDKELKSLVINNNYEIIDSSNCFSYFLKENPRGSK